VLDVDLGAPARNDGPEARWSVNLGPTCNCNTRAYAWSQRDGQLFCTWCYDYRCVPMCGGGIGFATTDRGQIDTATAANASAL